VGLNVQVCVGQSVAGSIRSNRAAVNQLDRGNLKKKFRFTRGSYLGPKADFMSALRGVFEKFPPFASILSGFFFSVMALSVRKLGKTHMSAVEVMFFRSLIPSIILIPIAFREGRGVPPLSSLQLRSLLQRGIWGASAMLTYFLAIIWSPISMATLTSNTSPLWTLLLAWLFLKEKIPQSLRWGLPMALLGCGLLALSNSPSDLTLSPKLYWGLASGMLSAVLAAAAYINIRILKDVPASWVSLSLTCSAMIGVVPWLSPLPWHYSQLQIFWIAILGLSGVLAQYLMTVGYQLNSAARASTLGLTTAPFAAMFGTVFLDEHLTYSQLLGLTLVLAGTATVTSGQEPRSEEKSSTAADLSRGDLAVDRA
jgi:drug/metabolite transporter (DMT)-like permease